MGSLLNALGEILTAILGGVLQFFVELAELIGKKNHDEKASFGSKKKVTTYSKSASFYIGDDAIDQHIAMNSAIVVGRTGASKSASIFKPSLLQTPAPKVEENDPASMSYVVLDPASELETDSAGWNEEQGYETEVINFSDSSKSSVTWNPLEGLSDSGVSRFASEYMETALRTSGNSDPFWSISSQRVFRCAINILRAFGKTYTNLYNARNIIQMMSGDSEKLDRLVSLQKVPSQVYEEYASIMGMGSKLLSSVLATTLASLEIFSDPEIAKVTSSSTLNMEEYRNKSKILYIQTRVMDQEHTAILNTLLFSAFFSFCMSSIPEENENTIAFMIDECSSLRMKPSLLPLACSNLRKHRSFGVFGFQSLSQIDQLYGKEHSRTITQNVGSKLFFPHQDLTTSQELSQMLGRYTYHDEEGRKHTRNLLTPDEVSFLEHKDGALLFSGRERGILLKKIRPYYKNRRLVKRSEIEIPEREFIDATMPALIPIDHILKQKV
jgi:type IV secretory pathway TraG/TraD family ATPase VirD4